MQESEWVPHRPPTPLPRSFPWRGTGRGEGVQSEAQIPRLELPLRVGTLGKLTGQIISKRLTDSKKAPS